MDVRCLRDHRSTPVQPANRAAVEVLAWKISAAVDRAILTIWMDGRPHSSDDAVHPFAGFTTGVWEGKT